MCLTRKKKVRNWHAAVAGALPHGSMYFKCGKKELGDSGWWALISPYWPQKIILDCKYILLVMQKQNCFYNDLL